MTFVLTYTSFFCFVSELCTFFPFYSKAIARQDTAGWVRNCHKNYTKGGLCRLGYPWPDGGDPDNGPQWNEDGWKYNCYVNDKIDNFWAPRLEAKMKEYGIF